jgi:hypothetical protein
MQHDNRLGTEVVLTTAEEVGMDPIVHVSSFVALLPSTRPLRRDSSLGEPDVVYARSKVETERIAGDLQHGVPPVSWTPDGCADWRSGKDVQSCPRPRRMCLEGARGDLRSDDARDCR